MTMTAEPIAPHSLDAVLARLDAGTGRRWATLSTGFDPLDRVLEGGLRTGDLALVGGLPGSGKTILTLQWARHLARRGATVVYACYEHDEASLVTRLLLAEAGELIPTGDGSPSGRIRALLREVSAGRATLEDAVADDDLLGAAREQVGSYADRLWLVRASGSTTDLAELEQMVAAPRAGPAALFVDYLQKVPAPGTDEVERVTTVVEGLKEIALTWGALVVAVAAGDQSGLDSRRLRLHHLRGSAALAYEADVVVLLNDKYPAVAKAHRAYDPVRAEAFKQEMVFTVEKNRDGRAAVNIEFRKDFEHYRFVPTGDYVSERLVDEVPEVE